MKHNILVISPFFFPEKISTGKYNTHMVEALKDEGHEVTVVCSFPLYPKWRPELTEVKLEGVEIKRAGLYVKYPGSTLLRRLLLELWFAWHVRRTIRSSEDHYTRVVLVYPPNLAGIFAARVFSKKTAKLIGIVHDLQGVLINSESDILRSFFLGGVKKLESSAIDSMDKVIYLSERMRQSANAAYTNLKPVADVAYPFVSIDKGAVTSRDYFKNNKINIVYSGALGEKQSPEELLRLFEVLAKDDHFCCHIFSEGKVFESLKSKANGTGVFFHPLVSKEDLVSLLCSSSLQVVPQVLDTSDGAFPSKIPNIINLNTPLLCITPESGELQKLLGSSGRALLCHHWDVDKISEAVKSFLVDGAVADCYDRALVKKFDVKFLIDKIVE